MMSSSSPLFFVALVLAIITLAFVHAGRLEPHGSIEDLADERHHHRNQRRGAMNPKFPESKQQEKQDQPEDDVPRAANGAKIHQPEVVGRGRHGWSHQQRRHKEEIVADNQRQQEPHPMLAHLTTEERAGILLLGRVEGTFRNQVAATRSLLQVLHEHYNHRGEPADNHNPHHAVVDRYERMEAELKAQEEAKREDVVQYKRITALEGAVNRLEYQLGDVKSYATEVSNNAAAVEERQRALVVAHEEAVAKTKKECEAAADNQELRVQALEKELMGKNDEVVELQNALNSLGADVPVVAKQQEAPDAAAGKKKQKKSDDAVPKTKKDGIPSLVDEREEEEDASSTPPPPPPPRPVPTAGNSKLRLLLVRHAEVIIIAALCLIPVLLIVGFTIGKSRGRIQGIAAAKKNEDIFRERDGGGGGNAGGAGRAAGTASPVGSGSEITNRTLRKFDNTGGDIGV